MHFGGDDQHVSFRIRHTERAGGAEVWRQDFPATWSGSGLAHHACGDWLPTRDLDCGYSWENTCEVDVQHGQGVTTTVFEFDLEIAVRTSDGTAVVIPE